MARVKAFDPRDPTCTVAWKCAESCNARLLGNMVDECEKLDRTQVLKAMVCSA